MPQGTIRKGFFFYFGLFVLLLFAIFLVCIVVMIFNPGKSVLWMEYFTDNTTYVVKETTVTEENTVAMPINWTQVTDLEINCTYGDVIVQRNGGTQFNKDGLYIINNAKGFTSAKNAVHFNVFTRYEGDKLKVDITEPQGFLYFSKNIKIILHAAGIDGREGNFSNLKLTVNTTDGDVNLGSAESTQEFTELKSAHVTTGKGDIIIQDNLVSSKLTKLNLETVSGDIITNKKVDSKTTGLETSCDIRLATTKGDIKFAKLSGKNVDVECKQGRVVLDNVQISGSEKGDGLNFLCERGNILLGNITGNVNFADAEDWINSPNITIDTIKGNFVLTSTINGGSPNININKITGFLNVVSTKGKLNVGQASGEIKIDSDDNLAVNVGVANGNNNAIAISNVNGYVGVDFAGSVSSNVDIKNKGNVTVNLTKLANFAADFYQYSKQEQLLAVAKIVIKIDNKPVTSTNPFEIKEGVGSGHLNIFTDGYAYINLVTPKQSKVNIAV